MHFIEWFTSRGELYEHNMRIIDQHLGKLSSASHPDTAVVQTQPYQSNITSINTADDRNTSYPVTMRGQQLESAGAASIITSAGISSSHNTSTSNNNNNNQQSLSVVPIQRSDSDVTNSKPVIQHNEIFASAQNSAGGTGVGIVRKPATPATPSNNSRSNVSTPTSATGTAASSPSAAIRNSSRRINVTRGTERITSTTSTRKPQPSSTATTRQSSSNITAATATRNKINATDRYNRRNNRSNNDSITYNSEDDNNNNNNNNNTNTVLDDIEIVLPEDLDELLVEDPTYLYWN